MLKKFLFGVTLTLAAAGAALAAYPDKPIRIVVPAGAGGGSDTLARMLGQKLGEELGTSVIVDVKPGASGTIGGAHVAKAEPDGYTLLITTNQHASTAILMKGLPYDPMKDFTHVVALVTTPMLLQVRGDSPINSVADIVNAAKAKPESVSFGSAGPGNISHLTGMELASQSKTKMTHVPYKGAGAATSDLLGGHVTFVFNNPMSTIGLVKEGKLKALAVSTGSRLEAMPNIPTMKESGFPNFDIGAWFGVTAPAKVPKPIVEKLNTAINKIMQMPDIRKRFAEMGVQPIGGSPEKFEKIVGDELGVWRRLAAEHNIQPE